MRLIRKIFVWTLVIVVPLFIILFIAASVYINNFKDNLERILTDNIGLETKIDGDISLRVTPGLSFVARDLKVISNETYLLKIEKTDISIDYLGVFKSDIDIRALRFIKPQVYVVRDVSGKYNFESESLRDGDTDDIHNLNLDEFSITGGRLLYIDNQYNDTLMVDGFDLTSEEIGLTGTATHIDAGNMRLGGIVNVKSLHLNMLRVDSLEFRIDGRGGKIAILPVAHNYLGGTTTGKVIFDFTQTPTFISVEQDVTGLNLDAFSHGMGFQKLFSGNLDYHFDLSFRSFNWSEAKHSITGKAILEGENLTMYGADLDDILTKYKKTQHFNIVDLGALFVAGPYGAVFTKGINFLELLTHDTTKTTTITKLYSNWAVINGVANAQDVAFSTNHYRIAFNGSLDFRNGSYNNVAISLVNIDGCAALTQNLSGPFEIPETESVSSIGMITGSVDNLWKDLTRSFRTPCLPVYKGKVSHPQ